MPGKEEAIFHVNQFDHPAGLESCTKRKGGVSGPRLNAQPCNHAWQTALETRLVGKSLQAVSQEAPQLWWGAVQPHHSLQNAKVGLARRPGQSNILSLSKSTVPSLPSLLPQECAPAPSLSPTAMGTQSTPQGSHKFSHIFPQGSLSQGPDLWKGVLWRQVPG